jgi:hypothetical protein
MLFPAGVCTLRATTPPAACGVAPAEPALATQQLSTPVEHSSRV